LTKRSRLSILLAAGLSVTLLAATLIVPGGLKLQVVPVMGGSPLLVLPMQPGEGFTLHYYHSAENAPIWEEHCLDEEGRIYLDMGQQKNREIRALTASFPKVRLGGKSQRRIATDLLLKQLFVVQIRPEGPAGAFEQKVTVRVPSRFVRKYTLRIFFTVHPAS
jgi:hypothetical protein